MRLVHVLREGLPKGLPVARNVLERGTGALSIDEARVQGPNPVEGIRGRWPSNVIMVHQAGCRVDGVVRVRCGSGAADYSPTGVQGPTGVTKNVRTGAHYGDSDGREAAVNWVCADHCPAAALNSQSGWSQSSQGLTIHMRAETSSWRERGGSYTPGRVWESVGHGDSGGAARFFLQVGGGG